MWASSAGSLWGIGTAAAAVLAIGVSWQLAMRAPGSGLPASAPTVVAKDSAQESGATTVEFAPAEAKADKATSDEIDRQVASAPATTQPRLQAPPASMAEPMREESEQAVAAPKPFPDEHVVERNEAQLRDLDRARVADEKAGDDRRADSASAAMAQNAPAAAGAPADAMAEQAANANTATKQLENVTVTGSRLAAPPPPAPEAPPPPVLDSERSEQGLAKTAATGTLSAGAAADQGKLKESEDGARYRVRLDARLYPESWILKIRSRLKNGDTAGARASLRLYVEHYPHEPVPDNLKPLLDE
jgi:hypothetical protein